MVQRQKPHPELKPSPALSHGPKAQSHYQELHREHREHHQHRQARVANKLAQGRAIKDQLLDSKRTLDDERVNAARITAPAVGKTRDSVSREAFKLMRRVQATTQQSLSKSQAFRQSLND